ncbi:ATP-binding protein [Luteolibacter algae]|uniref:histidine kinase n=1 Tax=Luteolibacter algae TaxID=454151 RepID=A0ABW5D584_9BACT
MSGLFLIILGLTVIIGWYAKIPLLVQIHQSLAPMQYNAALCFALAGTSLLIAISKKPSYAIPSTLLVFFIGAITLTQYLLYTDFGIDEFLFKHYIFTETSHPGRMSPATALVFTLSGLSMLAICLPPRKAIGDIVSGVFGSLVLALGIMALLGYITGLTGTYGWGQLTQMAMHTSTGAFFLGMSILAIAWKSERSRTGRSPTWLSFSATLAAFSATFILWNALLLREEQESKRTVQVYADGIRNEIVARMDSRVRALVRIAERWKFSGKPSRTAWENDALSHIADFQGYQAIAWVDEKTVVQWAVPLPENQVAMGKVLATEKKRRAGFEQARATDQVVFTEHLELLKGGMGMLIIVPMAHHGIFEGYIVGAIAMAPMMNSILTQILAEGYSISLTENGETFYQRSDDGGDLGKQFEALVPVNMKNAEWIAAIRPRSDTLREIRSSYPYAVLIFGGLFSLLLGVLIYFAQNALSRSQQIVATNKSLRKEISERQRAEKELDELGMLQQAILSHAAHSIISTTTEGIITSFNPGAERMLGYSASEVVHKTTPAIFHMWDEIVARTNILNKDREVPIEPGFETLVAKAKVNAVDQSEWSYVKKDGSTVPVNLGVTSLRDADGNITGFLGIAGDISELKEAVATLEETHEQLVDASHRAGMAEVATSVLHNVGNVLNSVNISCTVASDKISGFRIDNIDKTAALLRGHEQDLATFFQTDPRGQKLPEFLERVASRLHEERDQVLTELTLLGKNVDHIKEIVSMQQSYAMVSGMTELLSISELIEDSLRMNDSSLSRHAVEIVRDYDALPQVYAERHKALQILVNLIGNAKDACDDNGGVDKRIIIRATQSGKTVSISVTDNGVGIPEENLTRIFAHGFTTKKSGHGFGLHSCAIAAREMNGSLTVHSDGVGHGSTFTLELPLEQPA